MLEHEEELLEELRSNFKVEDWAGKEIKNCYEGHSRQFENAQEEAKFIAELLENVQPVRAEVECFEEACWGYFEETRPDWTLFDYEQQEFCALQGAGGEFHALPTVKYLNGGVVLFVAQSQVESLRRNPWICKIEEQGEVLYVGIDMIDELVVVPDEVLLQYATADCQTG